MPKNHAALRAKAKKKTGRPCGFDKEQARQRIRELVYASMEPLVLSQIANAQGVKFLISRDLKTGKFTVLSEEEAKARFTNPDGEREVFEVWDKVPNVQAFIALMDRTVDKPVEQVISDVTLHGSVRIAERLAAGRKRVADARKR